MGTVPPRILSYLRNTPYARDADLIIPANTPGEFREKWGITMQEAADVLISVFGGNEPYVMTGDGPMRITDQWGSIRAGYLEPSEPIGDSSSGIEPCGYEEL